MEAERERRNPGKNQGWKSQLRKIAANIAAIAESA
jgi:hypothetical protein